MMKKTIHTFLLCLSLTVVVYSQNKYYTYVNAKKLDTLFDASKLKSNQTDQCVDLYILKKILGDNYVDKKYFSEENPFIKTKDPFLNEDEPVEWFKDFNTFLDNYNICSEKEKISETWSPRELDPSYLSQSNDSRSSSSWQTAVLQGTADFMAQRFKDELTNFALNSLITNIKKKDSLKFKILFPKTLNYINTYLDPNKNKGFYYSDLNMLRYTAELDLNSIVGRLPEFIDSQSGPKYKSNFFKLNSKIIDNPEKFSYPKKIFDELARLNNNYEEFKTVDDLRKSDKSLSTIKNEKQLYLLDIFVNALKKEAEDVSGIWADSSDINHENISNNLTIRFYYALLWEQTREIKLDSKILYEYTPTGLDVEITRLEEQTDSLVRLPSNELKRLTHKAIGRFDIIEKAYKDFKAKESEPDISDYEILFIPVLETIDSFTTDDTPKLKNITPSLLEIEQAIANKDYKFVLPNLFYLLSDLKIGSELIDREFLNTISLIVNFTLVESAEDMKTLLNTYALPIGSSSLKRTGKTNISFNGYVGLTGGYEVADSGTDNSFFNLGLTAPIGLSFSHRYDSKSFISSGSIFVGFIDLGSLVNNSFEDNIEIQSDLSFQQFFVPSLGYFLNVKNSPFSFGVVSSYHFDSRALIDTPEADGIDVFRLNLSLLVDIPFFTLSHKN